MQANQTDHDWEYFGKTDPYWAVVTNESFRRENLDESVKEFFFRTGEEYIDEIFKTICTKLDTDFAPSRALDFGSGVGRLALPLAGKCEKVVGVDVSDSMLKEAKAVVKERGVSNIDFIKGDDTLSGLQGGFDLINSYIVLQHIPVERGIKLFSRLVDLLRDGGVGVLHVTYSSLHSHHGGANAPSPGIFGSLKKNVRSVAGSVYHQIRGVVQGKGPMQMNPYDLNRIFHILQSAGIKKMHMEFTDHSGSLGTILFFQKPKHHGKSENQVG
jgi:SAM-dependent methyltransferase